MAFEFVIEDSVEIYRDPGGELHHWTIVTGRLRSGTIRAGQVLRVPGADGMDTVGSALGFIKRGQNLGEMIEAESFPDLFGIAIWQLAPLRDTIAPGSVITDCTTDQYIATLLRLLVTRPERIFHPHGAEHPDKGCEDCENTLAHKPETIPLLTRLAEGNNPYFAARAAAALETYFSSPDFH
jgi:hypothetical protein